LKNFSSVGLQVKAISALSGCRFEQQQHKVSGQALKLGFVKIARNEKSLSQPIKH
jgi:hypothetical protein